MNDGLWSKKKKIVLINFCERLVFYLAVDRTVTFGSRKASMVWNAGRVSILGTLMTTYLTTDVIPQKKISLKQSKMELIVVR